MYLKQECQSLDECLDSADRWEKTFFCRKTNVFIFLQDEMYCSSEQSPCQYKKDSYFLCVCFARL